MIRSEVYEVVPDGERWKVVDQFGSCISLHATKEVAVNDARRVANANQPSRLIIRNADGAIEKEQGYGDGALPSSA